MIIAAASHHSLSPAVVAIMVIFILGIAALTIWYGRTR
jgi:hypothetical protein